MRGAKLKPYAQWVPLKRATHMRVLTEADIQSAMQLTGQSYEEAKAALDAEAADCEYWLNDIYQVAKRPYGNNMIHLNIRRKDGRPIFRDWRHFQRIKNELVGEECEAVELYPAESRLNDTSNKYHLWCFTDPKYRIPFGMTERDVRDDDGDRTPGLRQRKF